MNDTMGDRFKRYEQVTRTVLLPHSYNVIRVDGRAFHSYLRDAAKPFDTDFILDMMTTGMNLCRGIQGAIVAYGQSDEISVVLQDLEPQAQQWFGGVVAKMTSIAASMATASLMHLRDYPPPHGYPLFDARVFTLPSAAEVQNYLIWRQRDAVRNSVSMAAQAHFSQPELHKKTSGEMQEMLWREQGINWNDYPVECKRGWVATKATAPSTVTYTSHFTGQLASTTVDRTFWESGAAPHFTFDDPFFKELGL
jgi:tRNA(His) guanylyltransferase